MSRWLFALGFVASAAACTGRPAEAPDAPAPARSTRTQAMADDPSPLAARERAIRELLDRHDKLERFHIVIQAPFVVVGDGSASEVERRARGTIAWAVGRLKEAYAFEDPAQPLEVWLFSSHDSYRDHARLFFGDEPDTPYGYYSPARRALIMNIATGGGTLIHELVHPYIEANFSGCPAWFNEGLGSLYEASSELDGMIVGVTNWRLPGLQDAIRRGALPTFRQLLAASEDEFYEDRTGTNYAQSRYLLYYLQERGLLARYYARFHAARDDDPSGYATLREILVVDESEMTRFQSNWERWVTGLRWDP